MSFAARHDVIQTSLHIASVKADIKKKTEGKHAWSEISEADRAAISKDMKVIQRNGAREKFLNSIDHQKVLRSDCMDTWAGSISTKTVSLTRNGKPYFENDFIIKNVFPDVHDGEGEGDGDEPAENDVGWNLLRITPSVCTAFEKLKSRYQYFKINKISIRFVSNSKNNLAPIVCKYLPPGNFNVDNFNPNALDVITKYAESVGPNYGYLSISTPPYLVKRGKYTVTEEEKVWQTTYCDPRLQGSFALCNYAEHAEGEEETYLDFGSLIFECRNETTEAQTFVATIKYQIDYYTGLDYESMIEIEPQPEPPKPSPYNPKGMEKEETKQEGGRTHKITFKK